MSYLERKNAFESVYDRNNHNMRVILATVVSRRAKLERCETMMNLGLAGLYVHMARECRTH